MNDVEPQGDLHAEAIGLIDTLLDEELLPEQAGRLEQLVVERPDVLRLYLFRLHLWCGAMPYVVDANAENPTAGFLPATAEELSNAMILPAIRAIEQGREAPETSPPVADRAEPPPVAASRRFSWRMAAAILLPLMLAIAGWMLFRIGGASATLTSSVDARWASATPPELGQRLSSNELQLESGLAQVHFPSGASIIIQGPARFRIRPDNGVELNAGRLTAIVPPSAHGFAAHTPSAIVVDLGTGFGLSVSSSSQTEVDVFEGRVQVEDGHTDGTATQGLAPTTLSAGDSAVVANGSVMRSAGGATPQAFVRSLSPPPSVDLVDLICGGDGTTHRRSGAIDPMTGESGNLPPVGVVDAENNEYHPVAKLPAINGCFVPDGSMKVDSAGDAFDFGVTSDQSYYYLKAGGTFAWPQGNEQFRGILGGVDYSAPGHGLIMIHPNCGVTFDLAALRRLHPGWKASSFQAVSGNCHTGVGPGDPADILVLVDGVPQFARRGVLESDGAIHIDVALTDSDRFLTIAATCPGKAATHDWMILGDPRLE